MVGDRNPGLPLGAAVKEWMAYIAFTSLGAISLREKLECWSKKTWQRTELAARQKRGISPRVELKAGANWFLL
jgi:hypothetical protein